MDEQPFTSVEAGAPALPAVAAPARRRWPVLLFLLLAAFVVGVGATVFALPRIERWRDGGQAAQTSPLPRAALVPASPRPTGMGDGAMLDGRVVQLEERLNHITVEAQAASGNAARAEGLLVAFAARRALDSGSPLGYVEGQLRLRFGRGQPRAVATVINAAREPITLPDLRAGLNDVAQAVTTPPASASWWQAMQHEARELVTIRRSATPSPRPEAAFDRALHYVDAGRVSAALTEVERMPGRAAAERWMQLARRYLEARRALDLIETAAILEPRQLQGSDGGLVTQTSPLAP
ncbi:MAG: hypothetical protein ABW039_00840 [Sphingobium sp.]